MNEIKSKTNRGGAREGAGRKKGSSNKLSSITLLEVIDNILGRPFEEQLAINYQSAITSNEKSVIAAYDKLILSKCVADVSSVDVTSDGNRLQGAQLVFVTAQNPGFPDDAD